MPIAKLAAAVVLAAAVAASGAAVAGDPDREIPFVHGYKVERLVTYDIDGRRVGHIDVKALPTDARPVAWGEDLIGIRALDGRVVFVSRNDVILEPYMKRG